jgi:hypothetical protein
MDSVTIAAHKDSPSEDRVVEFLREVKQAHPGRSDVTLQTADWIHGYPDIEQLLSAASEQGLIDAWPQRGNGQDERGRWYFWDVNLKAKLFRTLKAEPRRVHRQVTTVDGREVDLRSGRALKLLSGNIDGLAICAESWLRNLTNPNPRVRHASETNLQDLIAFRYTDLADSYPELLAKAKTTLTKPALEAW